MELKASDLRIGNKLNYCGQECHLMAIYKNNEIELGYFTDSVGFIRKIDDKDISPIPILEDKLFEAVFVENKYEYSIPISDCGLVTLTLIPHDEQHSKFSVCVSQSDEHDVENVFLEEISFWHELQNLYKSISGKELNFTINKTP
jgi:hypothetical protein